MGNQIQPPIEIRQFSFFSYNCRNFGKASLQFASLLRQFNVNRNEYDETVKKSKLEIITGYKNKLERVVKSVFTNQFVQYITIRSSINFSEGKLKQLERSQIFLAIETVQDRLLCSDIATVLISQNLKTEGGDSFYEKKYGEERKISSGYCAISQYSQTSQLIMTQLNESFEFWKKTSEKHCTSTLKKVELIKAFQKFQEQSKKIQCSEMPHQPPPKLDAKQLKRQLEMSSFHTKRPENKIPQENDAMMKVEESQNGYEIALEQLRWLFKPPLMILPKAPKYSNMPVEKQYKHTFRDLFNSANQLKKHLKSGDQVQILKDIVDSRQGIKTLEDLVARSLFQIQTKISDVQRQFLSANNELVKSKKINPEIYPTLNIENEGACKSSLQNFQEFIPKEKEYLVAQELVLKWDSKRAIFGGKKTLLVNMKTRLDEMQKTYKFLSIGLENLVDYVKIESMSEIESDVPKYQSKLKDIQDLSNSEMKFEAEFTPDYSTILSAERQIAKCYEDKIRCILESCRYELIALLRKKMADERHQKNLRQSYERDEAAKAQKRRADRERREEQERSENRRRMLAQEQRKLAQARLEQKRRVMINDLWDQVSTPRSADDIKDGFRSAISYVRNNAEISQARYSWYCGLFWSGAKYDIILYDQSGSWRKRFYNDERLDP